MMKLSKLMKPIGKINRKADFDVVNVTSCIDQVTKNSVFIPLKGENFNSFQYVDEAIKRGAYVVQKGDNRRVSGILKQRFIGNPCMSMKCIGVIGTNGKSSVVHFLMNFLNEYKVAAVTDASFYINDVKVDSLSNTTPSSEQLMHILGRCRDEKCDYFLMEASSHAIKQGRIQGLMFDALIYTNISQDHLDYHTSIMEYTSTKLLGSKYLKKNGFILCNDDLIRSMLERYYKRVINIKETYPYTCHTDMYKQILDIDSKHFALHILSRFDVDNMMFAYAYMRESGFDAKNIYMKMMNMKGLKGRMELVYNDSFHVIIDYAHTYMAYYELCQYVKTLDCQKILVFGLGGNRDEYKREMIGELVGEYFDFVIVTSDNTRNEDPNEICAAITKKMKGTPLIIINRKEAIQKAVSIVEKDGIIIIAGKGNEDVQIIRGCRVPFKDADIVLQAIQEREV